MQRIDQLIRDLEEDTLCRVGILTDSDDTLAYPIFTVESETLTANNQIYRAITKLILDVQQPIPGRFLYTVTSKETLSVSELPQPGKLIMPVRLVPVVSTSYETDSDSHHRFFSVLLKKNYWIFTMIGAVSTIFVVSHPNGKIKALMERDKDFFQFKEP